MNEAVVITTKKAFPWRLIAASAGAVILIAALAWFLWPKGIEVPVVVGLDVGEAVKKIEDSKLKVEVTRQFNAEVAAGRVFAQEPAGKSKAGEGDMVKLLVADAKGEGPMVVFEDNFDNRVKPGWSQTKTEMTPNGSTRFLGQFGYERIGLKLSKLPPHETITLTFDLYVLNTWDGDAPGDGPDYWGVWLDNSPDTIYTTFSNQGGGRQRFACRNGEEASPACQQAGSEATTGAVAINSLGFDFPELKNKDCVYKIKRTFRHNKDAIDMVFIGDVREKLPENRNTNNESWGLDNVRIEVR